MSEKKVNCIVIDDGSVEVPIKNRQGKEIGVFYFRPTDFNIMERWEKLPAMLEEAVEPLTAFAGTPLNPDGTAEDSAALAALTEARTRLNKACDYLFDGNMSEAFFGQMNPFSYVGGRYYFESALELAFDYIADQLDIETKKVNKRLEKYTHGYAARTGKHKDGKK